MSSSSDTLEKQPLLAETSAASAQQEPQQEPSLSQLQANVSRAQREYMRAWSRTTNGKWHRRIMWSVTLLLVLFMGFCMTIIVEEGLSEEDGGARKVQLEADIMSKCPDARDCLHDLILPTMQRVGGLVEFRLGFVGNVTNDADGVSCKHGAPECSGNMIELCVAKTYPDPKIYLGFTMCLLNDYENVPQRQLVEDCALEHGVSMEKINSCMSYDDGEYALGLLRDSFNATKAAGVEKSCTIRLNNKIRCVRDEQQWYKCPGGSTVEDLVHAIKELSSAD